jgi:hypothetical protein
MKKLIDRFLDWLKIKPKTKPQEVAAWPFPSEEAIAKVEEIKKKPAVKKATTRVRKTRDLPSRATVAKKAVSKKAK